MGSISAQRGVQYQKKDIRIIGNKRKSRAFLFTPFWGYYPFVAVCYVETEILGYVKR